MAHFMCEIEGARGSETRLGNKKSGVRAKVRSWSGDAQLHLDHSDTTDTDTLAVTLRPEHGYAQTLLRIDDYGALLRAIDAKDPRVMAALTNLDMAANALNAASYKAA